MNDFIHYSAPVLRALEEGRPVLALESTVITHGLPYPQNLETARALESTVRSLNVTPATIAMIDGKLYAGLEDEDLDALGEIALNQTSGTKYLQKLGARDLPLAAAKGLSGGTTVSATLLIAHLAGIKVFATGGIGGVHRGWQASMDISADLTALAKYPLIIITAGCKAILDIPATLEQLESLSVPVYGWRTNHCPAFYTKDSPNKIDRVNEVPDIVGAYRAQMKMGSSSATVVMNPIPSEYSIPAEQIEPYIAQSVRESTEKGIHGKALTPFLLQKLADLTSGHTVEANLALLQNNVALGCQIALALAKN